MKLITDIDGVLIDMLAPVRTAYGITDAAITQWGIQECLGVDDRAHENIWDVIWRTPIYPYTGALDFLRTMKKYGEVYGLSQRQLGPASEAARRDFHCLFTSYHLVSNFGGKLNYLHKYPWDYYLEDCLMNAIRAGSEFGQDKVLLLDRPWNQSLDLSRCFTRVDGYNGVLDIVREAYNGN